MKNKSFLYITALVAVMAAVALSGCKEEDDTQPQRKILITDIPSEHNGKTIKLAITQLAKEKAYGDETIGNQMVIVPLKNVADERPFTGFGPFGIGFTITGSQADDVTYTNKALLGKAITGEITAMAWDDFEKKEPPQSPSQKKIIINEIPSTQSGRTITLTLLQSDTQKATANGTISTTSVTFEPKLNSQAFTGFGLFTVRLTVTSSPPSQSLTYETIKLILEEETNISWKDFRITEAN